MREPSRLAKGVTVALLTLIWGTTWAAIRLSLEGIPPLTGVALRFAIASVLLLIFARLSGVPIAAVNAWDRRLRWMHAVLSFCVSYSVVFWAEQWVPSGLASVLFATFPLMVAVMAHFALPAERLTVSVVLGAALGFTGIAAIFAEDFDRLGGRVVAVAALIMLASPVASAAASVAFKRWGSGIRPIPFNAVAMGLAAICMGGIAAVVERHRDVSFGIVPVAAVLYMAIIGTAVTFPLFFWLLKHMEARQVALIGYGTPIVALILGAVFLAEPVTTRTIGGSAMVVIGVAIASRRRRRS